MTAPKRRWFRFSLRTLFLSLALLSLLFGWVAWNLKWKRERGEMATQGHVIVGHAGNFPVSYVQNWKRSRDLPFGLRLVGTLQVQEIVLTDRLGYRWTEDDRRRYQAAFPEVIVKLEKTGFWPLPLSRSKRRLR